MLDRINRWANRLPEPLLVPVGLGILAIVGLTALPVGWGLRALLDLSYSQSAPTWAIVVWAFAVLFLLGQILTRAAAVPQRPVGIHALAFVWMLALLAAIQP